MGILLLANSVVQGHHAWYESWSFDAQCVFDDLIGNWGGLPGYWAEINIFLIVVFYPMQILLLFKSTSEFINERLWMRPLKGMDKAVQTSNELVSSSRSTLLKLRYQCQRFIYKTARAVYTLMAALLGSRTVSFVLDLFWFGYGFWTITSDRVFAADRMGGGENLWTFGQIIPTLLLCSTIFVFKETYEGEISEFESPQSVANACNR